MLSRTLAYSVVLSDGLTAVLFGEEWCEEPDGAISCLGERPTLCAAVMLAEAMAERLRWSDPGRLISVLHSRSGDRAAQGVRIGGCLSN